MPKFAYAILSGDKSVEFRRNGIPKEVSHMVLYSIKPEQKVIGYCEVKNCILDSPQALWRAFGKYGWISENDFYSYFENQSVGKCYLIEKSFAFIRPVPLSMCKSFSKSPQSFVYMNQNEWTNMKRKKKITANHRVEWTLKSTERLES